MKKNSAFIPGRLGTFQGDYFEDQLFFCQDLDGPTVTPMEVEGLFGLEDAGTLVKCWPQLLDGYYFMEKAMELDDEQDDEHWVYPYFRKQRKHPNPRSIWHIDLHNRAIKRSMQHLGMGPQVPGEILGPPPLPASWGMNSTSSENSNKRVATGNR